MEPVFISIGLNGLLGVFIYLLKLDRDRMIERINKLEERMQAHHESDHLNIARDIGKIEEAVRRCESRGD